MIIKIKNFIINIKNKIMFAICIDDMEIQGKAYHGRCNGYIDEKCLICPYFRDTNNKKQSKVKAGEADEDL